MFVTFLLYLHTWLLSCVQKTTSVTENKPQYQHPRYRISSGLPVLTLSARQWHKMRVAVVAAGPVPRGNHKGVLQGQTARPTGFGIGVRRSVCPPEATHKAK